MINIQSPHFSTCSKADLLTRLSPSFRNKRVPSVQDNYSQSGNLNKNSLRKNSSPSKFSQKGKQLNHKVPQQQILNEISYLKNQYYSLKQAYLEIIQQKINNSKNLSEVLNNNQNLKLDNQKLYKQNEKYKAKINFLENQIQRIKRQCYKLLEVQQFKTRKLQENLQEKQQALKNLLKLTDQHTLEKCSSLDKIKPLLNYQTKTIPEESLIISQDRPIPNFQNQSQFLSISLTSITDDSIIKHQISTKRKLRQNQIQKIEQKKEQTLKQISLPQNQNLNLKKMRKQLKKKLQINLQQKYNHKDCNNITVPPKTPVQNNNERKNSKLKNSKSKNRKNQQDKQNQSNRFSKKKLK